MTFKDQLKLRIDLSIASVLAKVDVKLTAFLTEINKISLLHKAIQFLYDNLISVKGDLTTQQNIVNEHDTRIGVLEESMISSGMSTLKGELFVNKISDLNLTPQSEPYDARSVVAILHSINNSSVEIGTYLFTISEGILNLSIDGVLSIVDESDIIVVKYNNDGNGTALLDTIKITKRELFGIGDIGTITVGDLTTANPNFSQELSTRFLSDLA